MRSVGIIYSVEDNIAKVRIRRNTACGENCAGCSGGCSAPETVAAAYNGIGAAVGDRVVLSTRTRYVLFAAFLVYILPLAALFAAYAATFAFTGNEGLSAAAGITAMAAVFVCDRLADKKLKNKCMPNVTLIL